MPRAASGRAPSTGTIRWGGAVPDAEDPSDIELVAAFRGGDASAFDRVFTRYVQRIRAVCQRYLGDGAAAEDMVQETFYNVVRAIDRVEDDYNFSAWIHRIAVNLCLDELRRRERGQGHVGAVGTDAEMRMLTLPDRDLANSPEGALEAEELRALVWEIARRLPERQRMVLTLRELQGLSYAAIGTVMGLSQSAVETLLHRARKRFKEEYLRVECEVGEGAVDSCAAATWMLRHVRHANLRRDQRRMLADHLTGCAACRAHHPEMTRQILAVAGRAPA